MAELVEIDSLTAMVIVDNEVDPMSTIAPDTVKVSGLLPHIAMRSKVDVPERGGATKEIKMEDVCCGHHGLSILLVSQLII
jgi:7,8-dihydropterin-6-yl-methyl-4-(beta-D-ribofuranosyl)aminobenzene 5'-phosphate synthase